DHFILDLMGHAGNGIFGQPFAGVESDLAQLGIEQAIGFNPHEMIGHGDGPGADEAKQRRNPDENRFEQRHHASICTTVQPAPRTFLMMSLSNFLRISWIRKSTALLSTSSPQP